MRSLIVSLILGLILPGAAYAQSAGNTGPGGVPGGDQTVYGYQTDFENVTDWTFTAPIGGVAWNTDTTPVVPSWDWGGTGFSTPSKTLNYNNETDYHSTGVMGTPTPNNGTASSPEIQLDPSGLSQLTFWCYFETEGGTAKDQRWVIIEDDLGNVLYQEQLFEAGGGCSAQADWHQHTIPLGAGWTTIVVKFFFDTIDEKSNNFKGWFLDELFVGLDGGSGDPGDDGDPGDGDPPPGDNGREGANGDQDVSETICAAAAGRAGVRLPAILVLILLGVGLVRRR